MRRPLLLLPLVLAPMLGGCYVLPFLNYGRAAVVQPEAIEFGRTEDLARARGDEAVEGVGLAGTSTEVGLANVLVVHRATLTGTSETTLASGDTYVATARVRESGMSLNLPFYSLLGRPGTGSSDLDSGILRHLTAPVSFWGTVGAFNRTGQVTERVVTASGAVRASNGQSDDGITFRTGVQVVVRPGGLLVRQRAGTSTAATLLNLVKVRGEAAYEFSPRNETIQSDPIVRDPTLPGLRLGLGLFVGL